jgi:hypothetical protein
MTELGATTTYTADQCEAQLDLIDAQERERERDEQEQDNTQQQQRQPPQTPDSRRKRRRTEANEAGDSTTYQKKPRTKTNTTT